MHTHFLNSAKKIVEFSVTFTITENLCCFSPLLPPLSPFQKRTSPGSISLSVDCFWKSLIFIISHLALLYLPQNYSIVWSDLGYKKIITLFELGYCLICVKFSSTISKSYPDKYNILQSPKIKEIQCIE